MNKYYTPDIEEFHVGFECEMKRDDEWIQYIIGDSHFATAGMEMFLKNGRFRVKYLDKEDICSTNSKWMLEREDTVGKITCFVVVLDSFRGRRRTTIKVAYNFVTHWAAIAWVEEKFNMMGEQNEHAIFSGFIKNKSEFKRILKIIGVDELD
jgi:hypothetical protein